jgi:hypothetical protein
MGLPLRREEGSDYYWSLPLYWGVTAGSHCLSLSLTPVKLNSNRNSHSESELCYDRRSVVQSILELSTHLLLTTRFLLLSDSCGFVEVGHPLWREDGSVFYSCSWSSPAQTFSGPTPMGLVIILYCLRFETSLLVASYDSQGYGGGIRHNLHTGVTGTTYKISSRTAYKTPFLYCSAIVASKFASLWSRYLASAVVWLIILRSLPSSRSTCHNICAVSGRPQSVRGPRRPTLNQGSWSGVFAKRCSENPYCACLEALWNVTETEWLQISPHIHCRNLSGFIFFVKKFPFKDAILRTTVARWTNVLNPFLKFMPRKIFDVTQMGPLYKSQG